MKVQDFGIVKAPDDAAGAALTRENTVQGTPAYMAPEHAMGSSVDGRADIYSTGCVAYWLLTGQPVFTGDTPMAVVSQHIHMAPVAPSRRTDLLIPPALDALVLSCLAKDRAARPQSAKELARRLAEVDCAGAWTDEHAAAWWRANEPCA